ncbi:hypothetical protein BDB01DRAFT_725714 [Pilobolus umbonatus]|nr:hypothetical protein BDB01DRAFT_725714 [Pilobolus umbonatus]
MGKISRKKLHNALNRMLSKQEVIKEREKKEKAREENMERAKKNQLKTIQTHETVRPRPNYGPEDRLLLLGEGNFSFARSLLENYVMEGAERMIATCFDSEEVLYEKYGDEAKENIEVIKEFGATVMFSIDATHLPKEIRKNKYTKIIFNFPHAGAGIKDQDRNIIANQALLNKFFESVTPLLAKAEGEIHVALKTCKPYNLWSIKGLAKATGKLASKGTKPFCPEDYPGYEHRRTLGFKKGISKEGNEEILSAQPKTFVFVRKEVMDVVNQKSIEGSLKRKQELRVFHTGKKLKKKKINPYAHSDDDE